MQRGHYWLVSISAAALLATSPAHSQTPDSDDAASDNDALASSNDAFGQTVGNESTGLYTSSRVRGFNPVDAGNGRIEGMYYDQVGGISARLRYGNTVRVGLSTFGHPLPAPTGVVDYSLNRPEGEFAVTFDGNTDFGVHSGASLEVSLPIDGERAGLFAGAGFFGRHDTQGSTYLFANFGALARWKPTSRSELVAFSTYQFRESEEARPTYYLAADALPPELERGDNLTQPWAATGYKSLLTGVIAKMPLGGFRLEVGAFYDQRDNPDRHSDLFYGVDSQGNVADRVIVAEQDRSEHSASGEVRLSKRLARGHHLSASLRLRDRSRLYGANDRVSLGSTSLLARDIREEPVFDYAAQREEAVSQASLGLSYSGRIMRGLRLDAGVVGSDYSRAIHIAGAPTPLSDDSETHGLWNLGLAYRVLPPLTLFATAVNGMEEAAVAPDRALNGAEAPAAIRTEQREIGLRFAPSSLMSLTVGAFEIRKPYFNLDPALYYRRLGELSMSGLEFSLVSRPLTGVTVLLGLLEADPAVEGEAVDTGLIGSQPVGTAPRRAVANFNWRPDDGESPWSFDIAVDHVGERAANSANSFTAPAYTNVDVGFRYRMQWRERDVLFRGKIENAANEYGWNVSSGGGFTYTAPRRVSLQIVAGF